MSTTGKLCGARHSTRDVYCTRPEGHDDYHVATYGAFSETSRRQVCLARWSNQAERGDEAHVVADDSDTERPLRTGICMSTNNLPPPTDDEGTGLREAARYLRDLADRLMDYPTDHYEEAVKALQAYADETEAQAVALGLIAKWRVKEPPGALSEMGLRAERERATCADELAGALGAASRSAPPADPAVIAPPVSTDEKIKDTTSTRGDSSDG